MGICSSQGGALARRKHARHGAWGVRTIIEERALPPEPVQPPPKHLRCAADEDPERRRRGRIRWEPPDCRALVYAAERRGEHPGARTAVGAVGPERKNQSHE